MHINIELRQYGKRPGKDLEKRPMIVAANKMDEEGSQVYLEQFKKKTNNEVEVFAISALSREGLVDLVKRMYELVQTTPAFPLYGEEEIKVYTLEDKKGYK